MKKIELLLISILLTYSVNAQFNTDESGDIIPFSVNNPKVDSLKKAGLINTVHFPAYNVDSIWWEKNAKYIIEDKDSWFGVGRIGGLSTDSTLHFFDLATRIRIEQGYLWILKLYSPTVAGFSVSFNEYHLGADDYLTAYTNFWNEELYSLYGYDVYHTKSEYELRKPLEKRGRWYYLGYEGNELYIEYFSMDSIKEQELTSNSIFYNLCHYVKKSNIPLSVKERYPYFDFEKNKFKTGYSYVDFMFDDDNVKTGFKVIRKNWSVIPENAGQLLIVYNDTTGSSKAKMIALERQGEGWKVVFPSILAGVGKNGFAPQNQKVEGDGKSPTGIFRLGYLFSYEKEVDTPMPFTQTTPEDKWIDDSESPDYNKYVRGETNAKSYENLLLKSDAYKYCMVIEYNTNPVKKGKGSAIFFHLNMTDQGATAGCVAIPESEMLKVLHWLDPAKNPIILMGNKSALYNGLK